MVCVQVAKRKGGRLSIKGVDSFMHGQSCHKCTCNSCSLFPVSNSISSAGWLAAPEVLHCSASRGRGREEVDGMVEMEERGKEGRGGGGWDGRDGGEGEGREGEGREGRRGMGW